MSGFSDSGLSWQPVLVLVIGIALAACSSPDESSDQAALQSQRLAGSTELQIEGQPGDSWPSYSRDHYEQRYAPATQINRETIDRLGLHYAVDLQAKLGSSATPLMVDGLLVFPTNWNIVVAIDALTGEEVWRYDPQTPRFSMRTMGGALSRGVASHRGKIVIPTIDGRLIAVKLANGEKLWEVDTFDGGRCNQAVAACYISGAPRVADGKVFIGFGGAEQNARGYVSAYDVENGDFLWRFYTVPGDPKSDAHPEHPEMVQAAATWGDSWNEFGFGGGGTVWDSIVYDPDFDQLLIGVGNGGPVFPGHVRAPGAGDQLFLASIVSLHPDTGEMNWYYQQNPGEQWDYTATQSIILAELEFDGELKKVAMQAPKNGFFYVLDRETGKLLSAEKYAHVTWAERIDLDSGRPVETGQSDYSETPRWVAPGPIGANNWQPSAYSPKEGLFYISGRESVFLYHVHPDYTGPESYDLRQGLTNNGFDVLGLPDLMSASQASPAVEMAGMLKAFNPRSGKLQWQVELPHFWNGGLLATAGSLVFIGTADGKFQAYDSAEGVKLWEFDTWSSIISSPISYRLNGEQYIALTTGTGMASHTMGYSGPTASYRYGNASHLLVFKLDSRTPFPEPDLVDRTIPEATKGLVVDGDVVRGKRLYHTYCHVCHGGTVRSDGVIPDLRLMNLAVHQIFANIVLDGVFQVKGMPSFSDLLQKEDANDIHAYILERIAEDRRLEQESAAKGRAGM